MLPVQLWAPRINRDPSGGSFADDLDRAERMWGGEIRMWLADVKEAISLSQTRDESVIPAEELNVVDIYHVDSERRIYPLPEDSVAWRQGIPRHLYRQWLNTEYQVEKSLLETKVMRFPTVENGTVAWKDREVEVKLGPVLPVLESAKKEDALKIEWPPNDFGPMPTNSVEGRSERKYGRVHRDERPETDGVNDFRAEKGGSFAGLPLTITWKKWPLTTLLPDGGGLDALYHRETMKAAIQRMNSGYYEEALREVRAITNRFLGEVEVPRVLVEFYPRAFASTSQRQSHQLLVGLQTQLGIKAQSVETLKSAPEFWRWANQPVKIARIRGWLGFFWWDFLQDITKLRVKVRLCEACGHVVVGGRKNRRFCPREENPECFTARRTVYIGKGRAEGRWK